MRNALKFFLVGLVVVAFAAVGVAAVLPHAHGANTPHHVCWISFAKKAGVASFGDVFHLFVFLFLLQILAAAVLRPSVFFDLFSEQSRGPPAVLFLSL